MILYKTLQHEIGLKPLRQQGLGTFGMREISVELIDFIIFFDEKNSMLAPSMSLPIMGQASL